MAAAQPLRISIIPRPHKVQVQPNTQSTNHALHSKPPETFRGSISVRSLTPSTKETHNPKNEKKNVDNLSNNFDKIPIKTGKAASTKTIGIALGVVIAIAALGGLGIGLYTVIGNSQTTSSTTTLSSDWNWCSTGTTVAGTGVQGYQPNQLSSPYQVKIGSDGALYVADSNYNHRISKWIIGSGSSTIVAGQSYPQSGSSLSLFNQPYGVYLDSTGKMYVTDTMNHRVMLWNNSATSGSIVAGNGTSGNSLNQLANPYSVTLDESSNKLYIADCNNHRIIGVQLSTLTPSLVAGGIGFGHSTAHLYYPTDIYWDSSTNSLYIVNNGNSIIIRWVIGGTGWTLVAGFVNIASATSMTFNSPIGLTFDSAGNLYVADTSNHRIQFFRSGDATGKTIAGVSGIAGSTSNSLYNPRFVAVDSQFNLYVADTNNYRVQMFRRC